MYENNIPFPRDLRHTLKLAQEYTDKHSGGAQNPAKKTVLFSGTPQKIDTGSMGIMYVMSPDNFLELAEGQDIYGELVVGGVTRSFVLSTYAELHPILKLRMVMGGAFTIGANLGVPSVGYVESLGGSGFGFLTDVGGVAIDIGEISLTLWTEIGGDKPYYISDLSLSGGTIPYVNVSNAKEALLRDALYYRNNDDQVGKAVGFLPMTDGFSAVFFTTLSDGLYFVQVSADSDGVTASTRPVGLT